MKTYRYSVHVSGTQVFEFEAHDDTHAARIVDDLNLISKGEAPDEPDSMHIEPELVGETVEEDEGTFIFLGE